MKMCCTTQAVVGLVLVVAVESTGDKSDCTLSAGYQACSNSNTCLTCSLHCTHLSLHNCTTQQPTPPLLLLLLLSTLHVFTAWVGNQLEAIVSTAKPLAVQLAGTALQDIAASAGAGSLVGTTGMTGLGFGTGAAVTAGIAAGQVAKAAGATLTAVGDVVQQIKEEKKARAAEKKAAKIAKIKQVLHIGGSKADSANAAGGAAAAAAATALPQGAGGSVVAGAQQFDPAMLYQPAPYQMAAGAQYVQSGQDLPNTYTQAGAAPPGVQYSPLDLSSQGALYSQTNGDMQYSQEPLRYSQTSQQPLYSQTNEAGPQYSPTSQPPMYSQTTADWQYSQDSAGMQFSQPSQSSQYGQGLQRPQYSLPTETDNGMAA
jgi:hypothetical protein